MCMLNKAPHLDRFPSAYLVFHKVILRWSLQDGKKCSRHIVHVDEISEMLAGSERYRLVCRQLLQKPWHELRRAIAGSVNMLDAKIHDAAIGALQPFSEM